MASSGSKLLEFMKLIGRLKAVKRTGWVRRGVQDPESVAGHMYRMAVLSFLVNPEASVNKDHCIKLSLVHDMAECIVGDLTPSDGISKEEKHCREKSAMEHMTSLVGDRAAKELYSLWEEYENQSTAEARFVKDLDKFDMILQAFEYEEDSNQPCRLQEFFDSTEGKFQSSQVKDWVEELKRQRTAHQNQEGKNSSTSS